MGPALQGTPVMQDGTSGRRPLQRFIAPVRRGRCPHIAPPAAQRGRRKRLPACRKSPDGLFRQAGRQNRKIKTTFYFAILVAAAGDWTRKGTLTVPFHTILPGSPPHPQRRAGTGHAGRGRRPSDARAAVGRRPRPAGHGHDRRGADRSTTEKEQGLPPTGRSAAATFPPIQYRGGGARRKPGVPRKPGAQARPAVRRPGRRRFNSAAAGGRVSPATAPKNQTGRRGGAAAPQLLMRDAPFIPATANEKKGEGQPLTLPTGTILPPVRRSSRRHTGRIPAP